MAVVRVMDPQSGRCVEYERRQPEKTVFYRIVQEHIETVLAEAEQNGSGYPEHVKHEFERFLSCGILGAGFARLQCSTPGCTFERLVGYSCKGRSICPSCVSRRMADCASQLVDHVLPIAPYRQWTLSLPYDVRLRIGYDNKRVGDVLALFLRTVFSWQRLQARRAGIEKPLTGAVTLCQRYGSILQFTPHFHSWLPDGVLSQDADGGLSFHRLPPPSDDDIDRLLLRVSTKVDKLLFAEADDGPVADDAQAVLDDQAAAVKSPLPYSRFPWAKGNDQPRRPRCSFFEGYSLHADLAVHQKERRKLERLLRYGLRPPFAQKRLSLTPNGKVRLKLRKPYYTGQTEIVLEPDVFLRRLIATIPPKRLNMVRFHGVFAPRAKVRPALQQLLPQKPQASTTATKPGNSEATAIPGPGSPKEEPPPVPSRYRRPWHELLKRVFDVDIICGRCGAKMHRISHIDDPETIAKILDHLGLPTEPPRKAPARAPPQCEFDFGDFDEPELEDVEVVYVD
jgi:hypothetical protein